MTSRSRGHALLSASAAARWLVCTPSAVLEAGEPESGSVYSEEGTAAHAEAERILSAVTGPKSARAALDSQPFPYEIGPYVFEVLRAYLDKTEDGGPHGATLLVEQPVDYSAYAPGGFGTADAVLIAPGRLTVYDLKYGKGLKVEAADNPQLRLYALGALNAFGSFYDIEDVNLVIVQPRIGRGPLGCTSVESLTVQELRDWGEKTVRPAAELAFRGEGTFVPGPHCRFCKVAGKCRARLSRAAELQAYRSKEPVTLTPAELGAVLPKLDELETWIKAAREYALKEALAGTGIPGYKLVEGRSVRRYADTVKVAEKLRAAGYADAVIYSKELCGLTEMEKLVGGRKELEKLLGDLIVRPAGKPALARESDPRPAVPSVNSSELSEALLPDKPLEKEKHTS